MRSGTSVVIFALVFLLVAGVFGPAAQAQGRGPGMRSVRQIAGALGGSSHRGGGSVLRGLSGLQGRGGSHGSSRQSDLRGLQGLGNLLDLGRRGYERGGRGGGHGGGYGGGYGHGGYGGGDWGRGGGYGGGGWGRYGDHGGYGDRYYDSDREYARAMRDSAIANAVVGVVGIIANSATAPYAVQQPYPGPVYQAPVAAPTYRVERVLVREAHYEEYQTWVPDTYDARTGETIVGHNVVRQRYVPELWQERQVQIYP